MGDVQTNTGWGRFWEAGAWQIGAWVGQRSIGKHEPFKFGPMTSSSIATYKTVSAVASNSGKAAWLTACGPSFTSWYCAQSAGDQDDIFEAAESSGALGLDP